jgi:hypothetical protein
MAIEMTPEEIEAIFREYNEAVVRGVPIEEDLARRMRDASVGLRGYTYELKQSVDRLKTSSIGLARALKNGESGASVYNQSIEAGADALATFLKPLGPIGRVIGAVVSLGGKLVSEVNQQTDALFRSYQDLNRFGAGVTTGLEGVMRLSQQMGYTVEGLGQFAGVLERSSRELALLGGTVSSGTDRFAQLISDVSDQREMWRRLGLDVEQQNEAYSGFIRITTISGRAQRLTREELIGASQEYLHNLVMLSRLTGQTVEELNTQREAFMAQQRFASVQRDLERRARDATDRGDTVAAQRFRDMVERNRMIIDSVPKELQTGVADAMTGFLGTSDASIQLLRAMPEFAEMLASQNFEYGQAMAVAEREAGQVLDNFAGTLGLAGGFDEIFGSLVGFVKMESAALHKTFPERIAAAEAEIAAQKAQQGAAADQAALRENQLRTAQNAQSLIGVLRGPVTAGMRTLATATGEASTALARIARVAERGAAPGDAARDQRPAEPAAAAPAAPRQLGRTPPGIAAPAAEQPVSMAVPAAPTESTAPIAAETAAPTAPITAETAAPTAPITAETAAPTASTATNLNVVNLPTPEFAQGGIATGPTSGYQAMLHGVEAVVPLAGGRSIPVQMPDMSMGVREQMQLMNQQMALLGDLVRETRANNDLTERLLKAARS